jgi:hypothetical protein
LSVQICPASEVYVVAMSGIVLPYEPQYVGHRNAEERRKAVSEWLRQRERELGDAPSVVPDPPGGGQPSSGEKS